MKKLTTLLGATAVALVMSVSAHAELRLGLDSAPYAPFASKDESGKQMGWEIEIGEAVCAAMGETCVWTPIAWDGIIPALTSKKIDAIFASMSITEERMKTIAFSDKYYSTPAALVAAKDSKITDDAASWAGKIMGVQVSTIHANYAEKHMEGKVDGIKIYQAFDEHNNDLVAGRVDAVLGDSVAFLDFLGSDAGKNYEIKATFVDKEIFGEGAGVGLRKEDTELRDKFNAAIKKIREDGTYDEITKKYFDFDMYGD